MRYCDHTESVIKWSSEEVIIPYRSPIDGKRHRYFPDFWLRVLDGDGQIKETLIEIKPKAQTRPPKNTPPKTPKGEEDSLKKLKLGELMKQNGKQHQHIV